MVFISTVAPASANGLASNQQPLLAVQAAAAASASPTAQQLLPSAVVATAYVPPQKPKPDQKQAKAPAVRTPVTPSASPSSALAAQLLAQDNAAADETVALFEPYGQGVDADPEPGGDAAPESFVTPRMGDQASAEGAVATPRPGGMVTTPRESLAALANALVPAGDTQAKAQIIPFTVQQAVAGSKASLTLSRGAAAYAMTGERNDTTLTRAGIEAIS